jgi:hypothetical protein
MIDPRIEALIAEGVLLRSGHVGWDGRTWVTTFVLQDGNARSLWERGQTTGG